MCNPDISPSELRHYKGDVLMYQGSGIYYHNVSGKMGWERLMGLRAVEYHMAKGHELEYVEHEDTQPYFIREMKGAK